MSCLCPSGTGTSSGERLSQRLSIKCSRAWGDSSKISSLLRVLAMCAIVSPLGMGEAAELDLTRHRGNELRFQHGFQTAAAGDAEELCEAFRRCASVHPVS